MTSAHDDGEAGAVLHSEDSKECLLLVGGYNHNARRIRAVVAAVEKRVLASPTLADFYDVRFVDLGVRPKSPDSPSVAVARAANELARPRPGAESYYFAFVVTGKSAAAVERVLRDCASDQVVSALPVRFRGVAVVDDRRRGTDTPDAAEDRPDIVLSPRGDKDDSELVTQIFRYAENLLAEFALGEEPGLPRERLGELQQTSAAALRAAEAEAAPTVPAASELSTREERKQTPDEAARARFGGDLAPVSARPAALASGAAGGVRSVIHALARVARRGPAQPGDAPPAELTTRANDGGPGYPDTAVSAHLVVLVLVSPPGPDAKARRRAQSVFRDVERGLAVSGGYWVHTIRAPQEAAVERLRPTGRHAKAEEELGSDGLDFASAVDAARAAVAGDITALEGSSWVVDDFAVVFCAENIPLADPGSVQAFGDLVQDPRASVAWVVRTGTAELIAPQLRKGVRVIEARRRTAAEITGFLQDPRARSQPPDPHSSRGPAR